MAEKFIDHYYVVEDLQFRGSLKPAVYHGLSDALNAYFALPRDKVKALGIHTETKPYPGALDFLQCRNGFDTVVEDWKGEELSRWRNPEVQAAVHEIIAVRNIHLYRHETGVTKDALRNYLLSGGRLDEILDPSQGQECLIFKADRFYLGDTIVYIPDLFLNNIPYGRSVNAEEIDHILHHCYTGDDIIRDCGGNVITARYLFAYLDWQHPVSALDEIQEEDGSAPFYLGV